MNHPQPNNAPRQNNNTLYLSQRPWFDAAIAGARFKTLTIATIIVAFIFTTAQLSVAQQAKYTDLRSIRAVVPNEDFGASVDFEATVTYVDINGEFIFVQQGDDAIFVHRPGVHHMVAGQRARIEGSLKKGDLSPIVSATTVTVVATEDLPTAREISDIEAEHDCRYLTFEFDVLQTRVNVTNTLLFARTSDNKHVCIQVEHPHGYVTPDISKLAGNCVRCTGVLGLQLAGGAFREPGKDENEIIGYKVLCNSFDNIMIVDNQEDAGGEAGVQMVGLSSIEKDNLPDGRFLTFAQVCLIDYSQPLSFVVCDGPTFMRFQLESTDDLEAGMLMRIGGKKVTDKSGQAHHKVDYLRYLGLADLPQPETTTIKSILENRKLDQRVTVEGTPIRIDDQKCSPDCRSDCSAKCHSNLILGDGEFTINVHFQDTALDALTSLDPSIASRVKISGVTEIDEHNRLQLMVGRVDDAQLLTGKTSLSRTFAIGLATLMGMCAIAAVWIKLLKNQVTQKQQFEAIFDNAGCPIFVLDGNLKIVDANQLAADLTGYSKDQLRTKNMPDLDKHIPVMQVKHTLMRTMETREVTIFPTKMQTQDKSSLDVEVHIRNLSSSQDPEKATFIAIFPDVTARNKYENELKKARDEAIKANEAKSQFVASMSHELRTPLNGVIGMTQLLESTDLTPIQADYLAACRTSGETLLTVIGDVLDFSKMEAEKLELEPQPTALIPFIENVVRATSLQQGARHVDLASFVDPRLSPEVMVDCNRLRQVIFNLVGNAAKFTAKGSITVTANCSRVTPQHADVQFIVSDTGIGIREDRIDSLFEAFEQFDSSTTRQFGGTGLGLTICKQIVELMGGKISAQSVEGKGSDFMVDVRLPFATKKDKSHDTDGEYELIPTVSRLAMVGMSAPISKLLRKMFDQYQVEASFFSADDTVPEDEFDVVLLNNKGDVAAAREFIDRQSTWSADTAPTVIPVVPPNCVIDQQVWERQGVAKPICKPFTQTRFLRPVCSPQQRNELEDADRTQETAAQNRALRVLICEDNVVNQMFAKEVCRSAGINVVICENGQHGIETLQIDDKFDAIFMDCNMPVLDGFEAARKIRDMVQAGSIAEIPVIALTANALAGDREKCLAAGMHDYLTKPFEIDDFLTKIRSHTKEAPRDDSKHQTGPKLRESQETQSLEPVFDFEELFSQFSNREFVLDLAGQFASTFAQYKTDFQVCLKDQDAEQVFQVAHRLKGSSGTVKADRINVLAHEIESAGQAGQFEKVEAQIAELLLEFDNFTQVVQGQATSANTQQPNPA